MTMEHRNLETKPSEERILQERAMVLSTALTGEIEEDKILRLVTFHLGEERYGVDSILLQEIQPLKAVGWTPVPCTPDFIMGAVNLRGRIYSIMDIACYLGMPLRPVSETTHLLRVQCESETVGGDMELCILSDDVPEVTAVPLAEVQPSLTTLSSRVRDFVRGIRGDLLVILDLERLLADPGIVVNE